MSVALFEPIMAKERFVHEAAEHHQRRILGRG